MTWFVGPFYLESNVILDEKLTLSKDRPHDQEFGEIKSSRVINISKKS